MNRFTEMNQILQHEKTEFDYCFRLLCDKTVNVLVCHAVLVRFGKCRSGCAVPLLHTVVGTVVELFPITAAFVINSEPSDL